MKKIEVRENRIAQSAQKHALLCLASMMSGHIDTPILISIMKAQNITEVLELLPTDEEKKKWENTYNSIKKAITNSASEILAPIPIFIEDGD